MARRIRHLKTYDKLNTSSGLVVVQGQVRDLLDDAYNPEILGSIAGAEPEYP